VEYLGVTSGCHRTSLGGCWLLLPRRLYPGRLLLLLLWGLRPWSRLLDSHCMVSLRLRGLLLGGRLSSLSSLHLLLRHHLLRRLLRRRRHSRLRGLLSGLCSPRLLLRHPLLLLRRRRAWLRGLLSGLPSRRLLLHHPLCMLLLLRRRRPWLRALSKPRGLLSGRNGTHLLRRSRHLLLSSCCTRCLLLWRLLGSQSGQCLLQRALPARRLLLRTLCAGDLLLTRCCLLLLGRLWTGSLLLRPPPLRGLLLRRHCARLLLVRSFRGCCLLLRGLCAEPHLLTCRRLSGLLLGRLLLSGHCGWCLLLGSLGSRWHLRLCGLLLRY
jgi:hypothetical protein